MNQRCFGPAHLQPETGWAGNHCWNKLAEGFSEGFGSGGKSDPGPLERAGLGLRGRRIGPRARLRLLIEMGLNPVRLQRPVRNSLAGQD